MTNPIRTLIERWRKAGKNEVERLSGTELASSGNAMWSVYELCADELEAALKALPPVPPQAQEPQRAAAEAVINGAKQLLTNYRAASKLSASPPVQGAGTK
jgi:hypothetical protein